MIPLVWKAGSIAVVGAVSALVLRRHVPELALVLGLVSGIVVLLTLTGVISDLTAGIRRLEDAAGIEQALVSPVYRVMVIAILTKLISQICRDAGEGTIALCCELAGTFAALAATLPLLERVLSLLTGLLA